MPASLSNQAKSPREEIEVRHSTCLKPGDIRDAVGFAGITTPRDFIPQTMSKTAIVSLFEGAPWDLNRPIPRSGRLEILDSSHSEGRATLWHSSAHVLGQALEFYFRKHNVHLSDGPALEDGGFFYDLFIQCTQSGSPVSVRLDDLPEINKICQSIISEKQVFDRRVVDLPFAREMFAGNPFKQDILDKIEKASQGEAATSAFCSDGVGDISLYRCGPFIDLCRGPHIPHTGLISSAQIHKVSSSVMKQKLYLPTPSVPQTSTSISTVQRVYGVSFATKSQFNEWQRAQQLAEKYDHRKVGKSQKLFMFHPFSPGSPFFLPHGTRIYNRLLEFVRGQYRKRGFDEIRTPQVFDRLLWQQSGHWTKYKEDMFFVSKGHSSEPEATPSSETSSSEEKADVLHTEAIPALPNLEPHELGCSHNHNHDSYSTEPDALGIQGLKPMNCPGHCLLFGSQSHSYRDLPVRYADFSTLHRNEISGALSGLTRVRAFAQDDAHIFCAKEQLESELNSCLEFVKDVYSIFGFPLEFRLSTRPENSIGEIETWNHAEKALVECLNRNDLPWEENPGDGAFYGPKVDIIVKDALGRRHQCATIQLDFNLPTRFGLKYKGADGQDHTPVMIHRAVLGSLERFMGVYMEHCMGKWPLWLSPRQISVCPVTPEYEPYAEKVVQRLKLAGFFADMSDSSQSVSKQVRQAQVMQYNYILVVGDVEAKSDTVSVRHRDQYREREEKKEQLKKQIQSDSRQKIGCGDAEQSDISVEPKKEALSIEAISEMKSEANEAGSVSIDSFIHRLTEEVKQYK